MKFKLKAKVKLPTRIAITPIQVKLNGNLTAESIEVFAYVNGLFLGPQSPINPKINNTRPETIRNRAITKAAI